MQQPQVSIKSSDSPRNRGVAMTLIALVVFSVAISAISSRNSTAQEAGYAKAMVDFASQKLLVEPKQGGAAATALAKADRLYAEHKTLLAEAAYEAYLNSLKRVNMTRTLPFQKVGQFVLKRAWDINGQEVDVFWRKGAENMKPPQAAPSVPVTKTSGSAASPQDQRVKVTPAETKTSEPLVKVISGPSTKK